MWEPNNSYGRRGGAPKSKKNYLRNQISNQTIYFLQKTMFKMSVAQSKKKIFFFNINVIKPSHSTLTGDGVLLQLYPF